MGPKPIVFRLPNRIEVRYLESIPQVGDRATYAGTIFTVVSVDVRDDLNVVCVLAPDAERGSGEFDRVAWGLPPARPRPQVAPDESWSQGSAA